MENGEGRKRAIFSTVVTGDIAEVSLSPFSSFASFRMRRCEQIKDERAEPNSFGVTVERRRENKAREGPFPSTLARRASRSEEWRG